MDLCFNRSGAYTYSAVLGSVAFAINEAADYLLTVTVEGVATGYAAVVTADPFRLDYSNVVLPDGTYNLTVDRSTLCCQ